MNHKLTTRAFTLLEMLLVIAIIAILAGIVIIAINPGRQLAQARNAQRASDLRAIHSAVQQYYIDNKSWPTTTMPSDLTEVCDENNEPSGCLDLSALVPDYLPAIPKDPQVSIGTNYQIAVNTSSQFPSLVAPSSTEYDLELVEIGYSSLVGSSNQLWTPNDITSANVHGWWQFTDSENRTINGAYFNEIIDKTGNGRKLSQTNNIYAPLSININNKVWASFDGINDLMLVESSDWGSNLSQPYEMWGAVIFPVSAKQEADVMSSSVTGMQIRPNWRTTGNGLFYAGGTGVRLSWRVAGDYIFRGLFNSGASAAWLNGATTVADGGTRLLGSLLVGKSQNTSNYLEFYAAEMLVIDGELSEDEQEKMQGYLAHTHGLTSTLPIGHSYKDDPPTKN